MSLNMVKNFMKEVGWGFLATSDGIKVGVRPMGSCVWMDNELLVCNKSWHRENPTTQESPLCGILFHG